MCRCICIINYQSALFSPTVVVDTLVEVKETAGQATLNVSISSPQPNPYLQFGIMFSLNVASKEGSASMDDISQFFKFKFFFIVLLYI